MHPEIAEVLEGKRRWSVVCADFRDIVHRLPLGCFDHGIHDPPYSDHVHGKQRRLLAAAGKKQGSQDGKGHKVRIESLGFAALTPNERGMAAEATARLVRRWSLIFSDAESNADWREALTRAGVEHVRVGAWVKENGQPQLSGDRPAVAFEAIEIAHQRKRLGRMRWNRGGHHGLWAFPIATDRNGTGARLHTTQKPLDLMQRLVSDFTDPDDVITDWFCGSGTTGVACLRLGRRFVGIERDAKYAEIARARMAAEEEGLTLAAARAGQLSLLGGVK